MNKEYKDLLLLSRNQYNISQYDFDNFCITYKAAAWVLNISIEAVLTYVGVSQHFIEYKEKLRELRLSPPLLEGNLDYYAFVFMVVDLRKESNGMNQLIELTWDEMIKGYSTWFISIQKMLESECSPLKLVKEHFKNYDFTSKHRNG